MTILRALMCALVLLALQSPVLAGGIAMLQPGEQEETVAYVSNTGRGMEYTFGDRTARITVPEGWTTTERLLVLDGQPIPRVENPVTAAVAVIAIQPNAAGWTMDSLRTEMSPERLGEIAVELGARMAEAASSEEWDEGIFLLGTDMVGQTLRLLIFVEGEHLFIVSNKGDRKGRTTDAAMREALSVAARSVSVE